MTDDDARLETIGAVVRSWESAGIKPDSLAYSFLVECHAIARRYKERAERAEAEQEQLWKDREENATELTRTIKERDAARAEVKAGNEVAAYHREHCSHDAGFWHKEFEKARSQAEALRSQIDKMHEEHRASGNWRGCPICRPPDGYWTPKAALAGADLQEGVTTTGAVAKPASGCNKGVGGHHVWAWCGEDNCINYGEPNKPAAEPPEAPCEGHEVEIAGRDRRLPDGSIIVRCIGGPACPSRKGVE